MQIKNVERILQDYRVQQSLFVADKKKEIWLNDSGKSIPNNFSCDQCVDAKILISIITDPKTNFLSTKGVSFGMTKEEIISLGGLGHFFQCVACEQCNTIYYLGIACIEPNYGRDVFVLHAIWKLGHQDN